MNYYSASQYHLSGIFLHCKKIIAGATGLVRSILIPSISVEDI
jgi:hypothetical protein